MDFEGDFEKTIISRKPWESSFKAGKIAIKKGEFSRAEEAFKKALAEAGKFGDDNPRLGNIHSALGDLYLKQKKYGESEQAYKAVIAIWENTLGSEYSGLIEIYENYADVLTHLDRADEAKKIKAELDKVKKANKDSFTKF